ncbi:hypothetical protein BDM02DRAFT_1305155 [Thelephora ganbajun]|uniref:Uncharacterized protein n=1 Tax=Thelephora ganbajun TaxID=370292 RepID=A0ACB6ZNL8_THEGA|nr:hypothetical protein BDM02DRAFT_1305155 [Thelephora ganbajun]
MGGALTQMRSTIDATHIGLGSASSEFDFKRSTLWSQPTVSNRSSFIKRVAMLALFLLPFATLFIAPARASTTFGKNVVPYIPQSFFFDWNDPTFQLPNPTTAQCDTIKIKWGRGAAQGPNPVAPYKLLVHTSSDTVPFVIDVGDTLEYNWTVPFKPGTQYEICMFDKNGATGGCQAIYTMYPSQTNSTPACANLTLPTNTLQVEGIVEDGPISRYGWINQCTDLSLVPKNGRPPYTMIVAPALHPPYKIVSNDMSPINWTVSLNWASPFFISLTDADGLSWANGPQHSGGGGPDTCLSTHSGSSGISVGVTVGSSVGGLVLGVIVGAIIASFFVRNRYNKIRRNSSTDSIDHAHYISNQARFKRSEPAPHGVGTPGPDMGTNQYLVEPFLPEGSNPTSPTQNQMPPAPTSAYSNTQSDGSGSGTQPAPHVYVVHHDAGGAPVTVFTGGAGVTELPPSYIGRPEDQPTSGGSNNFNLADRRPRPGPAPRKSSSQLGNQ